MTTATTEAVPQQSDAPADESGFGGFFERVEQSGLDEQYDMPPKPLDQAAPETQDDQAGKEAGEDAEGHASDGEQTTNDNEQPSETEPEDKGDDKGKAEPDPRDAEIARLKAEHEAAVKRMHEATQEAKALREASAKQPAKPAEAKQDQPEPDAEAPRKMRRDTLERLGREMAEKLEMGDYAGYAELQVQLADARSSRQTKEIEKKLEAERAENERLRNDFQRVNGERLAEDNAALALDDMVSKRILPDDHGIPPREFLSAVRQAKDSLPDGATFTLEHVIGEAVTLWRSRLAAPTKSDETPTPKAETTARPARKAPPPASSARTAPPPPPRSNAADEQISRMTQTWEARHKDQYA